ncbi:MAG TPA: hypothetical protein VL651_10535 [Bacteroidia bacterium]|jgi:hypothetical protein|nr:hypothetical protein [Bacteroidia bacterium]
MKLQVKFFFIAGSILAVLGFVFRIFHLPGGGMASIVGLGSCAMSFMIEELFQKSRFAIRLMNMGTAVLLIFILFRLQFWPGAMQMFIPGAIGSVVGIGLLLNSEKTDSPRLLPPAVVLCLAFSIAFIPASKLYYFIHLNEPINSEYRKTDFQSWDKYSWFLYLEKHQDEALKANDSAMNAYRLAPTNNHYPPFSDSLLQKHRAAIQQGNWKLYLTR